MMTTAILDRRSYEQISRETADVRTGAVLLLAVARLFYFIGWVLGKIVPCLMWCGLAVRRGYVAAHGPSKRQQINDLAAQVAELRMQLSRFDG